jgi:hypothetical protein
LLRGNGLPRSLAGEWRRHTGKTLARALPFSDHHLAGLRRTQRMARFECAMFPIAAFFLLRACQDRQLFSPGELSRLVEAIVVGSTGYRLVDYYDDSQACGEDSRFLGQFLIQSHEMMLVDLFAAQPALHVLREYTALYYRAEYLEKRRRWRSCPFRWEAPEQIGWKSAPLFAVLELILRHAGIAVPRVLALRDACLRFGAALQMIDDFADAEEDLRSGIETLALSGFYEACGSDGEVTRASVDSFLYPRRVKLFYDVTCKLFEQARQSFGNEQEEILQLHVEIAFHRLHQEIEFVQQT